MDIVKNAQEAADRTASSAKSGLIDLGTEALKLIGQFKKMEERGVNNALDYVGLQRKQSALVPIATFAAGAAIGGAIAMLVAPQAGAQLRRKFSKFLADEAKEVEGQAKSLVSELKEASSKATSALTHAAKIGTDEASKASATARDQTARDPNGTPRVPHS